MISLVKNLVDLIGFKTDKKLLVICSDDWGSIRLKDAESRSHLKSAGLNLDSNRFDQFDCLETNEDVELLFDVLSSHRDYKGNHPVLTALTNVANPDFDKIREADFQTYFYNDLSETYFRYPDRNNVLQLFREGISKKIFIPQFHGREHLQIVSWMKALAAGDVKTRKAFEHDFFFLSRNEVELTGMSGEYAQAFNFWDESELAIHREAIHTGTTIFENLFQYQAMFFTAPVLIYSDELNRVLSECGISIIDVPRLRLVPIGRNKFNKKLTYMGQRNRYGQVYINRNGVFETNLSGSGVESSLSQIEKAFSSMKPAILSNHRASFVGGIDKNNRAEGLSQLDLLLKVILKRWPTVEFMDITALQAEMNSSR